MLFVEVEVKLPVIVEVKVLVLFVDVVVVVNVTVLLLVVTLVKVTVVITYEVTVFVVSLGKRTPDTVPVVRNAIMSMNTIARPTYLRETWKRICGSGSCGHTNSKLISTCKRVRLASATY